MPVADAMRRASRTLHVFIALAVIVHVFRSLRDMKLSRGLKADAQRATAWGIALVLWPVVWNVLAAEASASAKVGFFWPFLVLVADLYMTAPRFDEARPFMRLEKGTVCSMAMWLCGMASLSGPKTPAHQRIFILPLLLYVVFIVPSIEDDAQADLIAALQQATFACVTGLFIGGVLYQSDMLPALSNARLLSTEDPEAQ